MTQQIKKQLFDYTVDVSQRIITSDFDTLTAIVQRLLQVKTDGKTIYTAGNGGSAATASHICNDLVKGCRVEAKANGDSAVTASHICNDLVKGCRVDEQEGFKAFCLSDSNAIVTCLANDYSYEDIFSIPLKTFAAPDDVLLVFSGSGRSPNIISALKTARSMGVFTIGFSGRDGGLMKDLCDLLLVAPTDSMEQIEDMHIVYVHALICTLRVFLNQ